MKCMEEWRPVEEFKGRYEVSNLGRVRSIERYINTRTYPAQIMKPYIGNKNSLFVRLRDGKKQCRRSVAKLVLLAFIGPPPSGSKQARHIDSNPHNNALSNLKWDVCKAASMPENKENIALFYEKAEHYVHKFLCVKGLCGACRRFGIFDENDVFQEALMKIWRNINAFDPKICTFENFCFTRTNDVFVKMYGKEAKKKVDVLNIDINELDYLLQYEEKFCDE